MNSDAYREFLLKSIPTAVSASGGKEVNCRCLFCPDSRDPKSKHMYISIPQSDSEPSLYNCYKCHNSGIVTYKKLIEWDSGAYERLQCPNCGNEYWIDEDENGRVIRGEEFVIGLNK